MLNGLNAVCCISREQFSEHWILVVLCHPGCVHEKRPEISVTAKGGIKHGLAALMKRSRERTRRVLGNGGDIPSSDYSVSSGESPHKKRDSYSNNSTSSLSSLPDSSTDGERYCTCFKGSTLLSRNR